DEIRRLHSELAFAPASETIASELPTNRPVTARFRGYECYGDFRSTMGMCSRGIFYLIFTPFVAKVTVHGPLPVETSSFAVKDVGVSSTMLKRHFLDSPHSVPSSGHTQVFPLTVPPLVNL